MVITVKSGGAGPGGSLKYNKGAGKSRSRSRSVANPATGAGVRYDTNVEGLKGYASAGVTVTEGPSSKAKQVVSGTSGRYDNSSRTYTTAGGQRVTVQVTPTSPEVQANREAEIRRAAEQGRRLSLQQEAELRTALRRDAVRRDGASIALNKREIDSQNEQFRKAGINNAGDFVREARAGRLEQQGNQIIIKKQEEQIYLQDTKEDERIYQPDKRDGGPNYFGWTDRFTVRAKQGFTAGKMNPGFKGKLEAYSFGVANVGYGFGSSLVEPVAWTLFGKRSYADGVPDSELGRYKMVLAKEKAQEQEGAFMLGMIGEGATVRPTGAKPNFIVEAKNSWLLKNPDKDAGFVFNPNKFGLQGREGVIVPGEFKGGTGIKGAEIDGTLVGKSPELQTQLYAKKITDPESMFAPEPYKPMSLSELSKSGQAGAELARRLAVEDGQTVFAAQPETFRSVADLSPSERLSLTSVSVKPNEFQRGLGEFKAPEGIKAKVKKGDLYVKTETSTAKLYSVDPLSASLISVFDRVKSPVMERPNLNVGRKAISGDMAAVSFESGTPTSAFKTPVLVQLNRSSKSELSAGSRVFNNERVGSLSGSEFSVVPSTIASTAQTPRTSIYAKSAQTQRQDLTQEQITITPEPVRKITETTSRSPFRRPEQKTKEPKRPVVPLFKSSSENKFQAKIGFDVLVKKRGRLVRANRAALNKVDAISFGASVVDKSSAASFKLVPSKMPLGSFKGNGKLDRFYKNRKGLFVEKTKFRINTSGERLEITDKGQAKNRFTNAFNGKGKLRKLFGGRQ